MMPSMATRAGIKFATAQSPLSLIDEGASAFFVPLANIVKGETGSWHLVFPATAVKNFVVVVLALAVLKPLRSRYAGAPGSPQLAGAN
jgi:OFA family oxalate/formate antiporter-like MFS transporter